MHYYLCKILEMLCENGERVSVAPFQDDDDSWEFHGKLEKDKKGEYRVDGITFHPEVVAGMDIDASPDECIIYLQVAS